MGLFRRSKEDDTNHWPRRTKAFLNAVSQISESSGVDFVFMGIEEKRAFLSDNHEAIIKVCCMTEGPEYDCLRHYHWFVVENEGKAVVYFQKK